MLTFYRPGVLRLLIFFVTSFLYRDAFTNPALSNATAGISIVTYNTWGLPIWIPGNDQGRRFRELPDSIAALSADIICLQETFSTRLRQSFIKKLSSEFYAYSDYSCNKTIFGPVKRDCHGGLMTWSRFPIVHEVFIEYNKTDYYNIEEKIGSKGFLFTTLLTSNGYLNVVNTHLYAGQEEKASKIRREQLQEMSEYLATNENFQLYPTILSGDLNLNHPEIGALYPHLQNTDSYYFLTSTMGFSDSCPSLNEKNYTIDHRENRFVSEDNPLQKLDYILFNHAEGYRICLEETSICMKAGKNLSDHLGFRVRFRMECQDIGSVGP